MKRVEIPLKLLLSKEAIEDTGIMYICSKTGLTRTVIKYMTFQGIKTFLNYIKLSSEEIADDLKMGMFQ